MQAVGGGGGRDEEGTSVGWSSARDPPAAAISYDIVPSSRAEIAHRSLSARVPKRTKSLESRRLCAQSPSSSRFAPLTGTYPSTCLSEAASPALSTALLCLTSVCGQTIGRTGRRAPRETRVALNNTPVQQRWVTVICAYERPTAVYACGDGARRCAKADLASREAHRCFGREPI